VKSRNVFLTVLAGRKSMIKVPVSGEVRCVFPRWCLNSGSSHGRRRAREHSLYGVLINPHMGSVFSVHGRYSYHSLFLA
jgi:hypothetical protein